MAAEPLLLAAMLAASFVALLWGVPAAFALGGVPLILASGAAWFGLFDIGLLYAFPLRMIGVLTNGLLSAIPFFILMSAVLNRAGLSRRMIEAMSALAHGSSRRLMLLVLGVATLLAASTGIIGATVVMLATLALPGLLKAGVKPRAASGLICASGSLGQIIPPSILLILLSDQVSNAWVEGQRAAGNFAFAPVTASMLFAAVLVPGMLLAGLYAGYIVFSNPAGAMPTREKLQPARTGNEILVLLPPVVLIVIVLGSILTGVTTPTEAAVFGAAAAIGMAFAGNPGAFGHCMIEALADAIRLTGVIFTILLAASLFSLIFRGFGGDAAVAALLGDAPAATHSALFAVMAAIFLLGFILEFVEIITIVIPVAAPALFAAGVDPVWFAALVALNLQTSFLTPPFGLALFYFRPAAPAMPTGELYRAVAPYVGLQLLALALLWAFPALATALPQWLL